MHKLTAFGLFLTLVAMPMAHAQTPRRIAAFTPEHCERLQTAIKNMELALQDNTNELKAVQAQIALAHSGSAADVDKMVAQSLNEVRTLRKKIDAERAVNIQGRMYDDWQRLLRREDEALKAAEKRLDFWTERESAALSGGVVAPKSPPEFLDELNSREKELFESRAQLHANLSDALKDLASGNCSEVARAGSSGTASWSGTWTFVGVNGGAVILQQTGSIVQGHLNVRGQDYPTFTLKISGATASGLADVGVGAPGQMRLTIFGKRFTGTLSAGGRNYEPDGYCTAGECLNNR